MSLSKTDNPRQIPVNDALNDVFIRIRKRVGVKAVSKGVDDMRLKYVFTFEGRSVHDVRSSFKTALRKANIKDFRFHDLRHTAASHVVINGGSLYDVQELLGHKTPAMSQRYAHLSPERKKKAVNLLNGLTASSHPCQSVVNRPDRVSQAAV
ncbi:site-specific integrase [Thermodesulfobacteriota bacterium]